MEPSDCVYDVSSVDSTLRALQSNRTLGIVDLVRTCPNVCNVVFGNGNPDLAGIGLFVCYCIQLGLLGISTLLYLATHYKNPSTSQDVHSRRRNGISKVQSVLAETTAYFAITVVASCFVRFRETPPLYEYALIKTIVMIQIYLHIVHVFFRFALPPSPTEHSVIRTNWTWADQERAIALHIFHLVANASFLISIQVKENADSSVGNGTSKLYDIIDACDPNSPAPQVLGRIVSIDLATKYTYNSPPWALILWLLVCRTPGLLHYFKSVRTVYRNDKVLWNVVLISAAHILLWSFGYLLSILCMIFLLFLHAQLDGLLLHYLPKLHAQIVSRVGDWEGWLETVLAVNFRLIEVPRLISATLMLWLIWDIAIWFKMVKAMREIMRSMPQSPDTQNEWGVGQVAAVVAWLPLITQIIGWLLNLLESKRARKAKVTAILPVAMRYADEARLSLSVGSCPEGPTTNTDHPGLGQAVVQVENSTATPRQIEYPFQEVRARTWSAGQW
ncbi:hypothetical protein EV426DRAFT_640539 [Tirmania nivea]|nr:hypothetical protein EV426DRAFT_640539 [Tirmania nivea]